MKHCPVCKTKVEDLYTGLCHNPDCTWEFEFVSEMTPEMHQRYQERLKKAKNIYDSRNAKHQHDNNKNEDAAARLEEMRKKIEELEEEKELFEHCKAKEESPNLAHRESPKNSKEIEDFETNNLILELENNLMDAIKNYNSIKFDEVLKNRLKLSATNKFKENFWLHIICSEGNPEILTLYLKIINPDINIPWQHFLPLTSAIYNKEHSFDMVNILIKKGANLNLKSVYNRISFLQTAISKGDLRVINLLLENGADAIADGSHLIDCANGNKEIIKILKSAGARKKWFEDWI